MRGWQKAAAAAAAAAGTLGAAAAFGFRRAVLRRDRTEEEWDKKIYDSAYGGCHDEIVADIQWFFAQKPEEVSIRSRDGLRLKGYCLEAPSAKGCVLLFHGFRSRGVMDFAMVLPELYQSGYSLLVVDQRAHGRSEGKYIGYGILERYDCQQWAFYMDAKTGGRVPLFLEGMSMGAATVMMAAELPMPKSVRGIVADCGYNSAWEEVRHCIHRWYRLPAFPVLHLTDLLCRALAGYSLRDTTASKSLANSRLPILLIHGTGDDFVPASMTAENYAAAAGEKRQVLVEGAVHAASYLMDRERCKKELLDFLDAHARL